MTHHIPRVTIISNVGKKKGICLAFGLEVLLGHVIILDDNDMSLKSYFVRK